jgi:integrase
MSTDRKGRIHLTEASVARLKLPKGKDDEIWFDDEVKGFGVRKRGDTATYILQYQVNGKTSRFRLGGCSEIRCEVARDLALLKRGEITKAKHGLGIDPALLRENTKADSKKPKPQTLGAMIADYLDDKRGKFSRNHFVGVEYHLGTLLQPLHALPVRDVKREQIAPLIRAIAKKHGDVSANRARGSLSALYRWAIGAGLADDNPVVGTIEYDEKPRERSLIKVDEKGEIDWSELVSVWSALPDNDYGNIVRLLTLTGCRLEEIGSLQWSEIDLEARTITLPPERTKNKQQHVVPLSGAALEILKAVPRRAGRDFVFGIGAGGYAGWSKAKANLDKAVQLKEPWVVHDLRRTAATGMADLGVQPHVIEAVLNHIGGHKAGVAGIYNRSTYATEKRAALELWASELKVAIARANGANVTKLERKT